MPEPETAEDAAAAFVHRIKKGDMLLNAPPALVVVLEGLLKLAWVEGAGWGIRRVETLMKAREAAPCPPAS